MCRTGEIPAFAGMTMLIMQGQDGLKPCRFLSMCAAGVVRMGPRKFREISMSSLFTFLLVVQALIAAVMIGVILMQKSEGGGLGVGGSPAGLLSARGAADFMTRATTVLATLFVGLSILLAALASVGGAGGSTIDTSLSKTAQQSNSAPASSLTGPAQQAPSQTAPAQSAPASDDPLAAAAAAASQKAAPAEAPARK
jgi:preprotein translocase subunit SecG